MDDVGELPKHFSETMAFVERLRAAEDRNSKDAVIADWQAWLEGLADRDPLDWAEVMFLAEFYRNMCDSYKRMCGTYRNLVDRSHAIIDQQEDHVNRLLALVDQQEAQVLESKLFGSYMWDLYSGALDGVRILS